VGVRRFIDAPREFRCVWTITLRDGSKAQCGRRKAIGQLCMQHEKINITNRLTFQCCGGNDEFPTDHTMDCHKRLTLDSITK
jgi:hypothetical protein